jgi:hypothetical protein
MLATMLTRRNVNCALLTLENSENRKKRINERFSLDRYRRIKDVKR